MRYFWCAAFLTLASAPAQTTFQSGPQPVSLLEIFTSEGCSSCPPAESWLDGLKSDNRLWKEIVPVAFHVDYWDDLGWKDRFAKREFTSRQKAYSAAWRTSSVYTPGFAVDGKEWKGWFNGSGLPDPGNRPAGKLGLRIENQTAGVTFSDVTGSKEIELHLVPMAMAVSSDVRAGENRGRKLAHSFVALDLVSKRLNARNGEFVAEIPFDYPGAKAVAAWVTLVNSVQPIQATGGDLK